MFFFRKAIRIERAFQLLRSVPVILLCIFHGDCHATEKQSFLVGFTLSL